MSAFTQSSLMSFARTEFERCLALAKKKNDDYATSADPFSNLRRGGLHGVAVRMDDKVSRLLNLTKEGAVASVKDEGVRDTLRDLLNYCWLGLGMLEEAAPPKDEIPPGATGDWNINKGPKGV